MEKPIEQKPSDPWSFISVTFLYILLLLALRGNALFLPAGGNNLPIALIELFFPRTILELILLPIFLYTGFSYLKSLKNNHITLSLPPRITLQSFSSLFSKLNISFGWSIVWRLFIFNQICQIIKSYFFLNNGLETSFDILSSIASIIFSIYVVKTLSKRIYNKELNGYGWPFVWRFILGTCLILTAFFLVYALFSSQGLNEELLLLDWVTGIPLLILGLCVVLGWAGHQFITKDTLKESIKQPN